VSLALFVTLAPAQGVVVSGGTSFGRSVSGRSVSVTIGSGVYATPYGVNPFYTSPGYAVSTYPYSGYPWTGRSRVTFIYSGPQVVAVPINLQQMSDDLLNGPSQPDTGLRHVYPDRRRAQVDQLPPPLPAAAPQPAPAQAAAPPPPAAPLPGENAGVFRPLDPENRIRARLPVVPEPEPAPAAPAEPPPPPKPALPPGASLVDRGRAAFAEGEYGRAADHFRRAAAADPADPLPQFLLVQTLTALGKYTAAAEAARSAVEHFPGWPALTTRPLDLYGAHAADYAEHLKRLEQTRAAHPDDPVLLFLSGHALWFDGRRDDARLLFRRAAPAFPAAERFLRPVPPAVI
jgi:hypothetical protein